uniref:Uncharacterized protein n=1 Tax=Meloidogyne enterolobii TaxID=390850 RepID=A0A6V7V1D6_MELEN|nr:unnamed protein product [Meloidogyne enterolobii]
MEKFKMIDSNDKQFNSESYEYFSKIIEESTSDYIQRIMQKLLFLVKNWKKQQKIQTKI